MSWPRRRFLTPATGVRTVSLGLVALVATACSSDYRPPTIEAVGAPAGLPGAVVDVEVDLTNLRVAGARFAGTRFEVRFELERYGPGENPAQLTFGEAVAGMETLPVEDLSDGRTTVTRTGERWFTGSIGPLRIGQTVFELLLDGTADAGGWHPGGRALESQTGAVGAFAGWRRHRFLVSQSDFFSGFGRVARVEVLRDGAAIVTFPDLETVRSDTLLDLSGGAVFAINRLGFDDLQRLDPQTEFRTAWQAGVGEGSNPQHVVVAGQRGFVSRYEPPFNDVAVFDPNSGRIEDSLDLSALATNPDATPRAGAMLVSSGWVFAALQDIDRTFTRYGEGRLAVIDPVALEVIGDIPLGGKNPFDLEAVRDGGGERVFASLAGIFPGLIPQELSGGVVEVDPVSLVSIGMALDDDVAGGNLSQLAMVSAELGYVVVSDTAFRNRVIAFDPAEGTVRRTVFETGDLVAGLDLDSGGVLAIPDRDFFGPALCLYRIPSDPDLAETPLGCVGLELPPFSVIALDR